MGGWWATSCRSTGEAAPEEAIISQQKLRQYLLSTDHPVGPFKAVFFRRLGYTEKDWKLLEDDLRAQHITAGAEELERTRYGRKFLIRAQLRGPAGTSAMIASLWVIRSGEAVPRLVTAYPGGE